MSSTIKIEPSEILIKQEYTGEINTEIILKVESSHSNDSTTICKCKNCEKCLSDLTSQDPVRKKGHKKKYVRKKLFLKCKYCEKIFHTLAHIQNHERTHTGEKPFKCQYCDKDFAVKHNLISHQRVHTGEKPYSCSNCDKSFGEKKSLIRHIRLHNGEKLFKCELCDKHYMDFASLKSHKQKHSGQIFTCKYCSKLFNYKENMLKHEQIHTLPLQVQKKFKCEICLKKFTRQSNLAVHKKGHEHDMKPLLLQCNMCPKQFRYGQSLFRHVQRHTHGREKFICKFCNKIYYSEIGIQIHEKKEHVDELLSCVISEVIEPSEIQFPLKDESV